MMTQVGWKRATQSYENASPQERIKLLSKFRVAQRRIFVFKARSSAASLTAESKSRGAEE